jgi:hypothetical protein
MVPSATISMVAVLPVISWMAGALRLAECYRWLASQSAKVVVRRCGPGVSDASVSRVPKYRAWSSPTTLRGSWVEGQDDANQVREKDGGQAAISMIPSLSARSCTADPL